MSLELIGFSGDESPSDAGQQYAVRTRFGDNVQFLCLTCMCVGSENLNQTVAVQQIY